MLDHHVPNAATLSDQCRIQCRPTHGRHGSRGNRLVDQLMRAAAFTLAMSAGLPLAFAQTQSPPAHSAQEHGAHPGPDQEAPSGATTTPLPGPGQGQAPNRLGGMPMMGAMGQDGMGRQGGMMGRGGSPGMSEMMGGMGQEGMGRQGGMMERGGSPGMGEMSEMMGDMSRMMTDMGRMMGAMGQMMPITSGMMTQSGGMRMSPERVEGRLAPLKAELNITPAQEPQWDKFAAACRSVAGMAREHLSQMRQLMTQGGGQAATAPERIDRYEQMLTMRLDAVRTMKVALDPLYASFNEDQKKTADQLLGGPMGMM